ncbi:hypothetical protein [Falsibacillus albus]|uniref:Uncharacterized protein n=1 Tax=Falsibacillus albus TaxID=2478915 RepID=A0A3L7JV14_9BACI|nr:hypothetical protein [Falsibacillus albus]RLQ94566.1 hypothetical protein D9X91_13580 [Falsibacillus albus]
MQSLIKKFILDRTQLLKIEELKLPEQAINEFDELYSRLISTGDGNEITYNSSYPLFLFLNYVIENKNVLVHGSNRSSIDNFEPRDSSLFNGKPIKAIFASSDGVWSLFFAVINRKGYEGSIRNLCLTVPTNIGIKRYYYFSKNHHNAGDAWTNGTIYFFSTYHFKQGGIRDEWVCEEKIRPLAKLSVTPDDFPFLDKVSIHSETDSAVKTILKAIFIRK